MNKNEKIIAGLILGAAAGIAAAIFLDTDKGKKVFADIKKLASETIDDAMQRLAKVEQKFKETIAADETDEDITLS